MLLRFLLVSAVASFGVDLPTWRQAASDVRTSVAWCGQQVAALAQAASSTVEVRVADRDEPESPMPLGTDAFADELVEGEAPPMPTGLAAFVSEPIGAEPMPTGLAAFAAEPTPEPLPAPATVPATEPAPVLADVAVDPDAGFQVVMNVTVNHFTADLASGALVPDDTALATIAEPPADGDLPPAPETPVDDMYPGLAFDLNREADGLPDAWQTSPSPAILASVPETPVETPEKAERLAVAIRLTGQAMHAWMSLLQAPSVALDQAAAISR